MRNHQIIKTFDNRCDISVFADGDSGWILLQENCRSALAIAFRRAYNRDDRRRELAIEKIGGPTFFVAGA